MLVAEKRQYYGALTEEQHKPETEKRRRKKVRKNKKLRALSRACLALALAMLIISRFAVISEYNYNIRILQTELEELQKTNERLELQNAQAQHINRIEEYALSQLGMYYPESRDIVYVAVERSAGDVFAVEADGEQRSNSYSAEGWFAVLASRVNRAFHTE